MSLNSSSIFSIATLSNIDSVLLRQFRVLPGTFDGTSEEIPPYFNVIAKERCTLSLLCNRGDSTKGYGYLIPSSPREGAFPFLMFNPGGECRLLGHVTKLEVSPEGVILWSNCNQMDPKVLVHLFWVTTSTPEPEVSREEFDALVARVEALESQGTDDEV